MEAGQVVLRNRPSPDLSPTIVEFYRGDSTDNYGQQGAETVIAIRLEFIQSANV